jgi:hypothetical protein
VDLNALNAGVLYVEQAVEIQPGIVRFVGNGFQIADSVQDFLPLSSISIWRQMP